MPGGWSIGVEFTFHAAFPCVASLIITRSRAAWLLLGSLLIGAAAANSLLQPILVSAYDRGTADRFLCIWFPNQMSVFALGKNLFLLLQRDRQRSSWFVSLGRRHSCSPALPSPASSWLWRKYPEAGSSTARRRWSASRLPAAFRSARPGLRASGPTSLVCLDRMVRHHCVPVCDGRCRAYGGGGTLVHLSCRRAAIIGLGKALPGARRLMDGNLGGEPALRRPGSRTGAFGSFSCRGPDRLKQLLRPNNRE